MTHVIIGVEKKKTKSSLKGGHWSEVIGGSS